MPTPVGTGQITIIDILDGISVRLSNSAHTVPTTSDGLSGDFTGCASTVGVWLGQLDESANWSAIAVPSGGVTGNLVDKTYTVTDMTTNIGYVDFLISRAGYSSLTARFTITKVKQGLTGPVVVVTPSRSATFTATDGVLDPGQPIIDLTANVQNITSPAYVWTFLGFDTTPTASITNVQRIRASDLGDASGATVTCTVNGTYVDRVSIVRLEKSTASPGATVGGTWGENLSGQPSDSEIMNTQGSFQAARAWNFNDGLEAWYASGADLTPTLSYAVLDSTSNDPIFYSPGALAVYGPGCPKIRARIRRTSGSGWDGTVYYSTYTAPGYAGHGFDPGYKRVVPTFPVGNNVWVVIEWDMSSLDAGANDWATRTILQIRLDLGSTVEDTFDIDWVAIGSVSPGSFGAPSGSPVGNSTADSVSDATSAVNDLTTGLNQRMRANADNILGGVLQANTVGVPVGLRVGSVSWDAVGNISGGAGLAITSKGIYGYNGTNATFAIDGTTGDATFGGVLSAYAVNAVNSINIAGNAVTVPAAGQAISVDPTTTEAVVLNIGTMNTSVGGVARPLYLQISFDGSVQAASTGGGLNTVTYRVKLNGSTVATFSFSATIPSQLRPHIKSEPIYIASPPSGDFTITVTGQINSLAGGAFANTTITLFALGVKR